MNERTNEQTAKLNESARTCYDSFFSFSLPRLLRRFHLFICVCNFLSVLKMFILLIRASFHGSTNQKNVHRRARVCPRTYVFEHFDYGILRLFGKLHDFTFTNKNTKKSKRHTHTSSTTPATREVHLDIWKYRTTILRNFFSKEKNNRRTHTSMSFKNTK